MMSSGRPSVSFVVHDLGANYIGPVVRMARYLQPEYDVQIVGPCLWGEPNAMYRREFPFTVVDIPRVYRFPDFFAGVRKLADAATGDILVVMKAFAPALPAALLAKRRRGARVAVYLDEWDGATRASWSRREFLSHLVRDWMHPCDDLWTPFWEKRLKKADVVLGTTSFLERKFNAIRYDLGADTGFFKPQPEAATEALRTELGLAGARVVAFGGVVRPHKGVEIFAAAVASMPEGENWRFVLIGPKNECTEAMTRDSRYAGRVICTGAVPHPDMPKYLAMADVLAVPLGTGLMASSQMPCKVYEAMAMEKPVLASAVSDVPEVLAGCGWTVEAGNPAAVAAALREIAGNPDESRCRARLARERCVASYSAETAGKQLRDIVRGLL
jgi:glycosyltransferase involved in cell wall biosynthesis